MFVFVGFSSSPSKKGEFSKQWEWRSLFFSWETHQILKLRVWGKERRKTEVVGTTKNRRGQTASVGTNTQLKLVNLGGLLILSVLFLPKTSKFNSSPRQK